MPNNPRHMCPVCRAWTRRKMFCTNCTEHDLAYTGGWVRDGLILRPVPGYGEDDTPAAGSWTPESIRATLRGEIGESK